MDRLIRKNVLAMSGRAIEAAGDVDVLLLDKTGTITLGNRMATDLFAGRWDRHRGADRAAPTWPAWPTKRPRAARSIALIREQFPHHVDNDGSGAKFIPFSAYTRMSGCDLDGRSIRKGAVDAVAAHVRTAGRDRAPSNWIPSPAGSPTRAARRWPWPTAIACWASIHLKDVVKLGITDRFIRFRAMGIRTVMITGDNPRTAAAIAAEAGVDDFLAEATPETKMRLIQDRAGQGQAGGHDRRRHQRRSRPGPGRRGRGHEHRHPGGQRSRQHDRSRLRSRPSCWRSSRSASNCS